MATYLPWQKSQWDDLLERTRSSSLPHALLLTAPVGFGKVVFAEALIHSLLCQSPQADGVACGECSSCQLLVAGTHPDLFWVEPEAPGKGIPVDRIRAVTDFFALKSQYGGRQIVFIHPAEAMNRFSANSLLKTLEEPTGNALLILLCSQPSLLLPTIRSRCQQVVFPRPDLALCEAWLAPQLDQLGADVSIKDLLMLCDGAPLRALAMCENGSLSIRQELMAQWAKLQTGKSDPLAAAKQWSDLGLPQATQWLSSWTMDLIRLKSGAQEDAIANGDVRPQLQKMAPGLELHGLFIYLEQITEYSRWASGQLNAQLAMEELMISWSRLQAKHLQR